jgi:Fur family transcriptional regulator, stress-responsive regulator
MIRAEDHHHHIVCRQCGRTEDTDCVVVQRPCLGTADGHGFAIDAAEVTFRGLCPACAAEEYRPLRGRQNVLGASATHLV